YLGLPHNVIEKIKTNNVLIDFFAPVLSSKLISHLAGYDVYTYDIGKQILLFHYPFYDIAGGPVEHFDLFGYKHFGIIGGIMFSAFLGMGVVILRNLVFLSRGNVFMTIVTCSIYFKMLAVILKPSILFAFMFDFLSVYISVGVISILLVGKRS
ncbi:TPA: O63 family O-antigen polymerase, partial [Escherichia coli]|nr:O63 family O-antigen polymerase [Escherichia coli]